MTEEATMEDDATRVVPFYERNQVQVINIPIGRGTPFAFAY